MTTKDPIPRSTIVFQRQTFTQLLRLHRERPWILEKEQALLDLVALCEQVDSKELIFDLLLRFRYLSLDEAQQITKGLVEAAAARWDLAPTSAWFGGLSDPTKANSGQVILTWCKSAMAALGPWLKARFPTDCRKAADLAGAGDAIVLIDDFVGTGDTLKQRCDSIRGALAARNVEGVRLYLVTLVAMEDAQPAIAANVDDWIVGEVLRKGISGHYTGADLVVAIEKMRGLEGCLSPRVGRLKLPSFGYAGTEALYSLCETSIPNNVFPIFWWPLLADGSTRRTFFSRA